ncbi:VOC family protein [Povalibacter sp.]|uniref:VOC family protein n=1 Tax=Povalibacter sp. TaxID=1962978 RepID=UPI002F3EC3FB
MTQYAVHEVYPYLRVKRAAEAIEFYKTAFGASELFRLVEPSGRVGHCEIRIGTTTLMLSDEYPEMDIVGPETLRGTTFSIHLHVDNADAWIARAVAAGAVVTRPATDAFYGERSGSVRDPFGHEWLIGHQIEEVSYEEMQRRYTALMNG